MGKVKRLIEEEMEKGNDILHPEGQEVNAWVGEDKWCYYSGMPSPKWYEDENDNE